MKVYTRIFYKWVLSQFWPKVVSWIFEITTDELCLCYSELQPANSIQSSKGPRHYSESSGRFDQGLPIEDI